MVCTMDEPQTKDPRSANVGDVFRRSVAAALGVLLVGIAAYLVYQVRDLLVQVLVAVFIAVSLDPLVRWLTKRNVKRPLAVALILGAFLVLLGLLMWLGLTPMLSQVGHLASDFPTFLNEVRERSPVLRDLEARFHLRPRVDEFAATFLDRIQQQGLAFGRRFLGALVSALLISVLTVYLLADLPRLRRSVIRLFPLRHRTRASHAVNVMVDKVGQYMIGNLLISLIAGVTSYIALVSLDVPFAVPLAVFVAITDLIPMIGAMLGAVVCTIVAVATTDVWPNAVILALFFLVYQQVENYVIAPRVMRNSVDMSAVAVLLAALVGGSVLGLIGALMAIPVAAAIKVLATPMLEARDAAHAAQGDGGVDTDPDAGVDTDPDAGGDTDRDAAGG
jgi:predicted PurR-regulated permease PerM